MRTLLVGLDAACEGVLAPLFEAGDVPTLAALFESGTSGPLESQIPPWTASAWPSLYTGTNPGKHGVFGFLHFDGYDYDVVDATRVDQPAVWELASQAGRDSVVVNVPVTHPPRPFEGALVPGYTAPEDPDCHPEGVLDELREALGGYSVYAEEEGDSVADRDGQLAELQDLATGRGAAFELLAERVDPAFGFLQFQVTDTVCHQFPGDRAALAAVYRAVDDALAGVLDACDPETVVVASDHGIGPYERRVAVNEHLRAAGFLTVSRDGSGMPTWAAIRDGDLRDGGGSPGVLARASGAAARAGLTAQRVGRVLDRLGLAGVVRRYTPDDLIRATSERVDFANSRAYVRSRVECGVRINLQGRDPEGVVPPEEYEAVRADLIELLSGLETPGGDPVFETVAPREQFFEGSHSEAAVDVVTVPDGFETAVTTWLTGSVFPPLDGPTWDHKREGIVALAGEGVDATASLEGAHLFDVAPTVLATLGLPAAERMDGSVLGPVEGVGRRRYADLDQPSADSRGTDAAVERRLSELGYLE